VKRTIAIKLTFSKSQAQAFEELQKRFSAACNYVAQIAFEHKERNRVKLHHLTYYAIREKFPELGAQMACNAIAKVSSALRPLKKAKELLFKKGCSVHFDKRTYCLKGNSLSLFTLQKRVRLELEISSFHKNFLESGKAKEAELVQKGKRWFFHLVLEDLKNIRERIKAKKKERTRLHRWAFDELRMFVEYKAAAFGIKVLYVNPAYTSQTCSHCLCLGHRVKHRFFCSHCGSLQHSDLNASRNLLRLGESIGSPTGDVNRRHIAALSRR